jgi:hypothetical protein
MYQKTTKARSSLSRATGNVDEYIKGANLIQESLDYDKFSFLPNNRDIDPKLKESLKQAMIDFPVISRMLPLIVNEKLQIIDGQHRYVAAQELGYPIIYIVIPGIGIEVARSMNIVGKHWSPVDYAESYAKEGNRNYQIYLECRDEYGLPHNVTIVALAGGQNKGVNTPFKQGKFEVFDEERARLWLGRLIEVDSLVPIPMISAFAYALIQCFKNDSFNYAVFRKKLALPAGSALVRQYATIRDYILMVEDIYNSYMKNKIRF